jgi:hypothetical protein
MLNKINKISNKIVADVLVKDYSDFQEYLKEHPNARKETNFVTPLGQVFHKNEFGDNSVETSLKTMQEEIFQDKHLLELKDKLDKCNEKLNSIVDEDDFNYFYEMVVYRVEADYNNYLIAKTIPYFQLKDNLFHNQTIKIDDKFSGREKEEIKMVYENLLKCFSSKYSTEFSDLEERKKQNLVNLQKAYHNVRMETLKKWNNQCDLNKTGQLEVIHSYSGDCFDNETCHIEMVDYISYEDNEKHINSIALVHELGHFLTEHNNNSIRKTISEYAKNRTANCEVEKISDVSNYIDDELLTKKDNYFDPYFGIIFGELEGEEILSLGLEYMLTNPNEFYMKDKELFYLILKIMQGKI